jgi:hypothetical protein
MTYSFCSLLKLKHCLPVLFHIHNDPVIGVSLVEGLIQLPDVAIALPRKAIKTASSAGTVSPE